MEWIMVMVWYGNEFRSLIFFISLQLNLPPPSFLLGPSEKVTASLINIISQSLSIQDYK
jgi:hypothetical protein